MSWGGGGGGSYRRTKMIMASDRAAKASADIPRHARLISLKAFENSSPDRISPYRGALCGAL